jgi:hypothetical protein
MEKYNKWGQEINLDKTRYMCVGQQHSGILLSGGELIKQCTQ